MPLNPRVYWQLVDAALIRACRSKLSNTVVLSLQMKAAAFLELEVSYYNERLAVWEPLLEPVPRFDNEFTYQRWRLQVNVKKSTPRESEDEALAAQFDVSSGVTTETNPDDEDEPDSHTVDTNREGTSTRGRRLSLAEIEIPEALLSVDISSKDVLQLTITKTTLQVFTALAEVIRTSIMGQAMYCT